MWCCVTIKVSPRSGTLAVVSKRRRKVKKVDASDAAMLIDLCRHAEQWNQSRDIVRNALALWDSQPVALRVPLPFAHALAASDTNVELVPGWLKTMPYDVMAVALERPLVLHDGTVECHYLGFLCTGIKTVETAMTDRKTGLEVVHTSYVPFRDADGIRAVWIYREGRDGDVGVQTVSVFLHGEFATADTLAQRIAQQREFVETQGGTWGPELDVLAPLSLQVPLYVSSLSSDVADVPYESVARTAALTDVSVVNVGWRVASALSAARATGGTQALTGSGVSGWRLPPHVRRAHWHRVRLATRGSDGTIIGDVSGVQGQDWEYALRWFPPTLVNVGANGAPDPVVRPLNA